MAPQARSLVITSVSHLLLVATLAMASGEQPIEDRIRDLESEISEIDQEISELGGVYSSREPPVEDRVRALEDEVSELRWEMRDLADDSFDGAVLILFGAFCSLWAQRTGRSAWLWFFLGLFFNIVTVIVLLYKNSRYEARPF